MAEKTSYPRFPESNWWALRTQFQKTLPSNITSSYLMSLLNLTTEKAASNLLPPLKQLGIIDETGKPTSRANDWRSDTKYSEACKAMIENVYPQELKDLFSGPSSDRKAVKEWFMHTAQLGDNAAGQAASMYILLNQFEPLSPDEAIKKPKASITKAILSGNSSNSSKRIQFKRQTNTSNVQKPLENSPTHQNSGGLMPTVHIDLQIHISPEANPEQIDAIFASMAKHLYK